MSYNITPIQNKRLHALLGQLGLMEHKADLVREYSATNSISSKDLTYTEAQSLINHLERTASSKPKPKAKEDPRRKMRAKVIHYLCLMGYTTNGDQPDYERINKFIINIGSNNPRKVILNFLYEKELLPVLNQVEAMYKHEIKRFNKPHENRRSD
jgi:hypothetical protein